jgi:hypothetical protein
MVGVCSIPELYKIWPKCHAVFVPLPFSLAGVALAAPEVVDHQSLAGQDPHTAVDRRTS